MFYAGLNPFGQGVSLSCTNWQIYAFDSRVERNQWLENNRWIDNKRLTRALAYKEMRRILLLWVHRNPQMGIQRGDFVPVFNGDGDTIYIKY